MILILLKKLSHLFLGEAEGKGEGLGEDEDKSLGEDVGAGALTRINRRSVRLRSCHWTCSPCSRSNAAASGSGMFT